MEDARDVPTITMFFLGTSTAIVRWRTMYLTALFTQEDSDKGILSGGKQLMEGKNSLHGR